MTEQVKEQEQVAVVENRTDIECIFDAIRNINKDELEAVLKLTDYDDKKVQLAKLVIAQAHKRNELNNVDSSSTMREKLYAMIAYNTKKAIAKEQQREVKKTIKADAKLSHFFSSMYAKAFEKNIK